MRQNNLFIAVIILVAALLLAYFGAAALSNDEAGSANGEIYSGRVLVPLKRPTYAYGNPSIGPKNAPVTIFSFGDYQCAPCATLNQTLVQLRSEYPNEVRIVWKDMPDANNHPLAVPAANAARCAAEQGLFWEFHGLLMGRNAEFTANDFTVLALQAGANIELFDTCVAANRGVPPAQRDQLEGQRLGISATPTLFINERRVVGAVTIEQLRTYVSAAIAAAKAPAATTSPTPAPVTP